MNICPVACSSAQVFLPQFQNISNKNMSVTPMFIDDVCVCV
jgi:hypothetical protein